MECPLCESSYYCEVHDPEMYVDASTDETFSKLEEISAVYGVSVPTCDDTTKARWIFRYMSQIPEPMRLKVLEKLEEEYGGGWEESRWWHVIAPDGSVWCETSDESEARQRMRPGDRLQRLYIRSYGKWLEIGDEAAPA